MITHSQAPPSIGFTLNGSLGVCVPPWLDGAGLYGVTLKLSAQAHTITAAVELM